MADLFQLAEQEEAALIYRRAIPAAYKLGIMYQKGLQPSDAKATVLFKMAADGGVTEAGHHTSR